MVPVGRPNYLPNAHLMAAVTQWGERETFRKFSHSERGQEKVGGSRKKRSFCFLVVDPDGRAPIANEKREKPLRGGERKWLTPCDPDTGGLS